MSDGKKGPGLFERLFTKESDHADHDADVLKILNPEGVEQEKEFTAANPGVAPEAVPKQLNIDSGAQKLMDELLEPFDENPVTYKRLQKIISTLPPYSPAEAILANLEAAGIDVSVIKKDASDRKEAISGMIEKLRTKVNGSNEESMAKIEKLKAEISELEDKIRHGNALNNDFGSLAAQITGEIDGVLKQITTGGTN